MIRMSQRESIIWLVVAIVCHHLLSSFCKEIPNETRDPKEINWKSANVGPRTIDALSGNCGKFSAIKKWQERKDAFCDEKSKSKKENVQRATVGEFPSYVGLEVQYSGTNVTRKCSGVLIHPDAILTANHCIGDKANAVRATVGLNAKSAMDATQQSYAWGYCRLFNKNRWDKIEHNNVVLILLRKPFTLNERVQPACLELRRKTNEKVNCYAAALAYDNSSNQITLQSVPFLRCPLNQYPSWGPNAGHCYYKVSDPDKLLVNASVDILGSGLYCTDKCKPDKTPVVYTIGIVAGGLGIKGSKIELISLSKTDQFAAPMTGMLENCIEFIKE